jgi:hypothetical protein
MGEVVDGKNENEVGEKRIRERIARLGIHVGLGGARAIMDV